MDLPKKELSNTTGRNMRNTALKKAVIQIAGQLGHQRLIKSTSYMNGRATTWGVFKAYVVFFYNHFGLIFYEFSGSLNNVDFFFN